MARHVSYLFVGAKTQHIKIHLYCVYTVGFVDFFYHPPSSPTIMLLPSWFSTCAPLPRALLIPVFRREPPARAERTGRRTRKEVSQRYFRSVRHLLFSAWRSRVPGSGRVLSTSDCRCSRNTSCSLVRDKLTAGCRPPTAIHRISQAEYIEINVVRLMPRSLVYMLRRTLSCRASAPSTYSTQ